MELSAGVVEYQEGGESPVFGPPVRNLSCELLTVLCFRPKWPQDSSYFLLDSTYIFILNKILT